MIGTTHRWPWVAYWLSLGAISLLLLNFRALAGLWHWLWQQHASDAPIAISLAIASTTVIIGLTAIGFATWTAHNVARLKATLDLIEKRESTEFYRQTNALFSSLRRGRGFAHLNNPTKKHEGDRALVRDYLNHYELVSLGIRTKVLNGAFYRAWMGGPFVRDWNAASDWIQRERWKRDDRTRQWGYDEQIFEHFEYVATSWSTDAVRLKALPRTPPADADAGGVSDEPLPALTGQTADVPADTVPAAPARATRPFVSFITPRG